MTPSRAMSAVKTVCRYAGGPLVTLLFTAPVGIPDAGAADADLYAVIKTQHYNQLSPGGPDLPPTNGYSFQSVVYFANPLAVTQATVRTPGGLVRTLSPTGDLALLWEQRFDTSTSMDIVYPHEGFVKTYTLTMSTVNDGVQVQDVAYTFASAYPVTPQVLNWQDAQAIDQTTDFTLRWNNLGGNPQNPVGFSIQEDNGNVVYATPLPFATNALNGTSNHVTIPAHTLMADRTYIASLSLALVSGQPNTNYALGAPALAKETRFPVQTRAAPAPPTLTLIPQADGAMKVRLTGEGNRTYQILSTTNWSDWQSLFATNSLSGEADFVDLEARNLPRRFYRGQVGQ